ncbi:MAG: hypothetical protein K6T83_12430 [Alicyclobacillus sp.]|nr:hypothetical protein [Alicyclobacillus sp.]
MFLNVMVGKAKIGQYPQAKEFAAKLSGLFNESRPYQLRFGDMNTFYVVTFHETIADLDAELKQVSSSQAYQDLMNQYIGGFEPDSLTSLVLEQI